MWVCSALLGTWLCLLTLLLVDRRGPAQRTGVQTCPAIHAFPPAPPRATRPNHPSHAWLPAHRPQPLTAVDDALEDGVEQVAVAGRLRGREELQHAQALALRGTGQRGAYGAGVMGRVGQAGLRSSDPCRLMVCSPPAGWLRLPPVRIPVGARSPAASPPDPASLVPPLSSPSQAGSDPSQLQACRKEKRTHTHLQPGRGDAIVQVLRRHLPLPEDGQPLQHAHQPGARALVAGCRT